MEQLPVDCPICDHETIERVDEKTTIVCANCQWPFELYEDGRIAPSALAHVRGPVTYENPSDGSLGGYGRPEVMTLEKYRARKAD